KKGAQVMLLKNDPEKRWVNGTLGRVTRIGKDLITVRIGKRSYPVERAIWEINEHYYDAKKQTVETGTAGTFTQFPLRSAWAMTTHKSQGPTFAPVLLPPGPGPLPPRQTLGPPPRCSPPARLFPRPPTPPQSPAGNPRRKNLHPPPSPACGIGGRVIACNIPA